MLEPFTIAVADEQIVSLHARLRSTIWPRGVLEDGGISMARVQRVADYWTEQFDWGRQQARLNALPHFRATVGGTRLHFIHLKSRSPNACPLLLLHGWPGSFVEMIELVPLLHRAFDLVIPSLPGYGFSDAPTASGMSNAATAELMAELMTLLGYDRFIAHGGDWGAGIASWLGLRHPRRLYGIHLNYVPGSYAPAVIDELADDEQRFMRQCEAWWDEHGAYGHVQRRRPLTLSYGLSDSPVGLAAWIVEKFDEWADPSSDLSLDVLLTNVMVYWLTNTIGSSVRLYLESLRTPLALDPGVRIAVPCAIAHFPLEAPFPPRAWVERGYDVVRWTEMPRGGHFAALEQPALLAADILEFADSLRR